MKKISIGIDKIVAPAVVAGCMRFADFEPNKMNRFIHRAIELGVVFFDHADIYGDGRSEEVFGSAWHCDGSLKREDMIIQSKCGIRQGYYDFSKKHILDSVDGSLKRLKMDYLDILLLHRPDALVEPEEVADAFDTLEKSGKVRYFGVSNHNPGQMELLKKYVKQPLIINQLQFSVPVSNMVAAGLEVNMDTAGSIDRDGGVLDYCRLNDVTIQAWSPFQMPAWRGCFLNSEEYSELNRVIGKLSDKYAVSATAIATAWIMRHPAHMQVIAGTTEEERLREIVAGCNVELTREEWYRMYLASGHILP